MGNLFASTGLGDEKPHERDVEYWGFAGRRPYERQNENPETPAVHNCRVCCQLVGYHNITWFVLVTRLLFIESSKLHWLSVWFRIIIKLNRHHDAPCSITVAHYIVGSKGRPSLKMAMAAIVNDNERIK